MQHPFTIEGKSIGVGEEPYLIAEISGNHKQDINLAKELIQASAEAGAHAVKLQTYTADTITLNVKTPDFQEDNTLWNGRYLYDLYKEAFTPWEWTQELAQTAKKNNITLFSSPFDNTAVGFLEKELDPPVYKIASCEVNHIPLLKKVGATGKPVFISTGLATEEEIHTALATLKTAGCPNIAVLKCISAYPANPEDFNLRSIPLMQERFDYPIGLSDHSLGHEIAHGAVALGACVIEKHIILDRTKGGIDSGFSLEPKEFAEMAHSIASLHKGLGRAYIGPTAQEKKRRKWRRSIYVSAPIQEGEALSEANIKIVRPAHGLEPAEWDNAIGQRATRPLETGTALKASDFSPSLLTAGSSK